MKDPLSRVLLAAADSKWAWFPFARLRRPPSQRLSWGWVGAHAVSALVWAGLPFLIVARLWLRRWAPEAFLIPGAVGLGAGLLWHVMLRQVWNARAADLARRAAGGLAPPEPIRLTAVERWIVRPVAIAGVLALAVSLVFVAENLRGSLALRAAEASLRARGAPVSIAEVTPPPVPDERNLAMAPLLRPLFDYERVPDPSAPGRMTERPRDTNGWERSHRLCCEDPKKSLASAGFEKPPHSRWIEGLPVNLAAWQAYYRSLDHWPKPESPESPSKDVLLALTRNEPELGELRAAAAQRPDCRFPLQYEDGFSMLLPHLAVLKGAVQVLRLEATALLAEGRTDEALASVLLAFRLSDGIRDEPILISHLVRLALDQLILQPVWEGCRDHRWNDAQLSTLQQAFASRDHVRSLIQALHGERVMAGVAYDYMARGLRAGSAGSVDTVEAALGASDDAGLRTYLRCTPRGWVRQNQVAHIRYVQALVEDLTAARSHADMPPPGTRLNANIDKNSLFNVIAAMLAPAIDKASDKGFQIEAWRRLALVGLTLERYRLAEGRYPESLESLAPRFLKELPADAMDGRPLRYALLPDRDYRLYSVGLDHRDDGGRRVERDARGRMNADQSVDLVWR